MRVRWAVALTAAVIVAGACAAPAPPAPRPPSLVGVINGTTAEAAKLSIDALRQGLEALGYQAGRDVTLDVRYMEGQGVDRAAQLAQELVAKGAAIIVVGNPAAVEGARRASSTLPIVMAGVHPDPVGQGWVASLAKPAGNVTGLSLAVPTAPARRLQLLKDIVPGTTRVGVLHDDTLGDPGAVLAPLEAAAKDLGVELKVVVVKQPAEIDSAIGGLRAAGIAGALVNTGAMFATNLDRIARAATAQRVATSIGTIEGARAGCLVAFAADQIDTYRRAAAYVDKILKGAKAGDLPVERPDKFATVVNLKTAQALGLTVPESILAQATEVIR